MSYKFGSAKQQPVTVTPNPVQQTSVAVDVGRWIMNAIGIVSLVMLLTFASCTHMAFKTMRRATEILSIPDKLFQDGQIEIAVDQYKQVYPELVSEKQRKHALKRIISHDFGKGDHQTAAFWGDVAASEGYDLTDNVGVEGTAIRTMVQNAIDRHDKKRRMQR